MVPFFHIARLSLAKRYGGAGCGSSRRRQAAASLGITPLAIICRLLRRADRHLSAAIETVYLRCLHLNGSSYGESWGRQLMPVGRYEAHTQPHANMLPQARPKVAFRTDTPSKTLGPVAAAPHFSGA